MNIWSAQPSFLLMRGCIQSGTNLILFCCLNSLLITALLNHRKDRATWERSKRRIQNRVSKLWALTSWIGCFFVWGCPVCCSSTLRLYPLDSWNTHLTPPSRIGQSEASPGIQVLQMSPGWQPCPSLRRTHWVGMVWVIACSLPVTP